VWSDQYGHRLQFAGTRADGDLLEVVEGTLGEAGGVAVYRRDAEPVAVLAVDNPRAFTRWRRELAAAVATGRGA
jgi:hypothetical protein